jgi:hypothetical protein
LVLLALPRAVLFSASVDFGQLAAKSFKTA